MSGGPPPSAAPARRPMPYGQRFFLFLGLTGLAGGALFWGATVAIPAAPVEQQRDLVAPFQILYATVALLAALTVQGAIAGAHVVEPLAIRLRPNRGWAAALLVPPVLAAAALALALLEPGTSLVGTADGYAARLAELAGGPLPEAVAERARSLGRTPALALLAAALAPGSLLFQTMMVLPSEVAWRGFVHHALGGGVWRTGAITGLLWGVWSVPLIALGRGFAEAPWATGLLQVLAGLALGPWLAWLRERTGSTVATALALAVLTRLAGLPTYLVAGGSRWVVGQPGFAFVGALVLGLVLLRVVERAAGRAAAPRSEEPAEQEEERLGEARER